MAREDIERMISESLEAADAPPGRAGKRPLPHGDRILDQYAALCRAGESREAEPSAEVILPVTPSEPAPAPERASPIASMVKRALARVKR